jgi:hypothetical protein
VHAPLPRELEAAERRHARVTEDARCAAADAQEAWRGALSEKLKREAAEKEAELRERLAAERDAEVEVRGGAGPGQRHVFLLGRGRTSCQAALCAAPQCL